MRDFQKDTGIYPLGTLMLYGPDLAHATKCTAAILASPDSAPVALERWYVSEGDIREDTTIAEEVAEFFEVHGARETVASDRVTGCPHEEGVDYPLGQVCPECPFWSETDRFTHGPKSPTDGPGLSGYISADEIIVALSEERGQPPREALKAADARREEITDRLLAALEAGLAAPSDASGEVCQLFCHALLLLAKWREPRAFAPALRWLSLPDDGASDLSGDMPAENGARILASVCGGDRPEIRALVENREANEFLRSTALDSLAVLAAWGELPRETVIAYMGELITGRLEREHSFVWDELACLIADLDAEELVPLIREPYDTGLVDPQMIKWNEIEERVSHTARPPFEEFQHRNPPITDVAEESEWWSMYNHVAGGENDSPDDSDFPEYTPPFHASPTPFIAQPKIGRNDQCPCGSGRKYKKCCGGNK